MPGEMRRPNVVADMDATCVLCLCQDHRVRDSSRHHNLGNDDSMEMT